MSSLKQKNGQGPSGRLVACSIERSIRVVEESRVFAGTVSVERRSVDFRISLATPRTLRLIEESGLPATTADKRRAITIEASIRGRKLQLDDRSYEILFRLLFSFLSEFVAELRSVADEPGKSDSGRIIFTRAELQELRTEGPFARSAAG